MKLINIASIKRNFIRKFPKHPLTKILMQTEDLLSEEEFLGAVLVWLQIIDLEEEVIIK